MVVNRGTLKCLKMALGFGAEEKVLKDMACYGAYVGDELGVTLEDVTEEHFRHCKGSIR